MADDQLPATNTHVTHTRDTYTHSNNPNNNTMHTGRAPLCAMREARRERCIAHGHGGAIVIRKDRTRCSLKFRRFKNISETRSLVPPG